MKFSYTAIVETKEFSFIYTELSLQWVSKYTMGLTGQKLIYQFLINEVFIYCDCNNQGIFFYLHWTFTTVSECITGRFFAQHCIKLIHTIYT